MEDNCKVLVVQEQKGINSVIIFRKFLGTFPNGTKAGNDREDVAVVVVLGHCTEWVWCQAVPSMSVPEGQRAALNCSLHADNCTGPVSWYKQSPGAGPQLVLSYYPNNTVRYGQGFDSSRFTILVKGNETLQHQLLITSTTKHDTAVYYCGLKQCAPST